MLLVPAATAWSAGARAAEQSPPPAPAAAPQAAAGKLKLVPEQLSTLFKIDDDNPEAHVPSVKDRSSNPLEFGYYLQDLLTRAEVAEKQHNQLAIIKYYRAVAMAIPEEAQGWGRLCEAYQNAGDRDRAVRACKYAIDRKGAQAKDYRRYVELITAKPGDLLPEDRDELKAVFAHLDGQADMAVLTAHLRCEAGVKMKDQAALEACTAVLAKTAPDDPKTIVFQWSLAVMRGDRDQAVVLLERAQKAGVAQANIDRMSQVSMVGHGLSARGIGVVLVGAATLMLALALLGVYRRRLTATRRLAP